MFPIESFRRASHLKKSGKPRCTGLWAWGDNHMRAVELYRESIEASQVWVQGGDHLENPNASWPVKKWDDKKVIDFQGRGTTFLSWKCSFSYQEMIANSESCPYDTSSQLVTSMKNLNTWPTSWKPKRWSRCCHHSSQHLDHILSDKDQKKSSKLVTSRPFPQRCRWVRTFWPMDVPKMGSISSEQTEKNLVLTTPTMISGLRFEKFDIWILFICWNISSTRQKLIYNVLYIIQSLYESY